MRSVQDMKESLEQSSSSIVISINNKLDATPSSAPGYTIFKVHELLRRENEMAYEPEILAIGPYHRGKPRLQVMEDEKLRWLKKSLEQVGEDRDLSKYVEAMRSLEPKARQCYSESTSHVNHNDFVEMMLLDACFIIQFMRRYLKYGPTDPFFEEEWVIVSLIRDMITFENQIPLFVLQELFPMIRLPDREPIHFHEFALQFFLDVLKMMYSDTLPSYMIRSSNPNDANHMLAFLHDLLRSLAITNSNTNLVDDDPSIHEAKWNLLHAIKAGFEFIITRSCRREELDRRDRDALYFLDAKFQAAQNRMLSIESIPSAAKLHAAGVEFRSKRVRSSPFDVSFENGVMEIPAFSIHDMTESLYRNLIAYEQYSGKSSGSCVGLHVKLMDCLIDSAEDVALLRECGIVVNALGDDEVVSTIFNKLENNVIVSNRDSEVHSKLFKEVNAYCGKRRHKWMAKLRRDYFNSPWALISFFAAVFLLVLTLTQTVFSIWGVL